MNKLLKYILMGFLLVFISTGIYVLQIFIFNKPQDTFFYLFQDLAFLPLQILIVTLIITKIIAVREKNALQNKMYMVIGAFFTQLGVELLKILSNSDINLDKIRELLNISAKWKEKDFISVKKNIENHNYKIKNDSIIIKKIKDILINNKSFLLSLLENQNLLEHELFSDLLWAVCHLMQELEYRKDIDNLSKNDYEHISNDIKRVYVSLISQWLLYVNHLRTDYPFVYSLILRTNPFNPNAKVEIED
ncbi:MAG: hypothetical protein WCK67_01965 [bacterium]